jgi:hypothetical protein
VSGHARLDQRMPLVERDASINEKAGTSPAATEEKRGHHRQRNR